MLPLLPGDAIVSQDRFSAEHLGMHSQVGGLIACNYMNPSSRSLARLPLGMIAYAVQAVHAFREGTHGSRH